MRLSIRAEQRAVLETVAEENFVHRIAAHLAAEYPQAEVTLPDETKTTVAALEAEKLDELVRVGIARARSHEMTHESSIAAFVAVMFEVAPNFDTHRLSQVLLSDEDVAPNNRLDELLNVLTEKNWESIKKDYDPQAWKEAEEKTAAAESTTAEKSGAENTKIDAIDPFQTVKVDYKEH